MRKRFRIYRPGYERWGLGTLRGPGRARRFGAPRTRYVYRYGAPDFGVYGGDMIYEVSPTDSYFEPGRSEHPRNFSAEQPVPEEVDLDPGVAGSRPLGFGPMTNRYQRLGFRREPAYTGDDYKRGYDRGYLEDADYDSEGRMWWDRASDEIASWFGDDEAQRRREIDAYMDGNRGRGPKSYVRSDERIFEDVNELLTEDFYVDASEIDVKVNDGTVTLEGTIPNRVEKRMAEDLALCVSGVKEVEDRLTLDRNFYGKSDRKHPADKSRAANA